MTTAVKRACDACHRRKVKCDGINPCRNCSAAQLSCTYNAIPQKKGPKGSRAKVISELRETQRQTSLSAKVQNRMNGLNGPAANPSLAPTPGLLSNEMIKACIDFYFANMHQNMPILHRQRLEQQAMYMDQSLDTYCLLTSLCAFMMLQPGMGIPGGDPYGLDSMPGASIVSGTLLMEETIRVRKGYDYIESPSLNSLCTSFFLFGCYYGLDLHEKAWFHLREATTLVHMIGMNKEETYLQYDSIEAARRRRLYWLLFVTERAYALQRNRPLTLQATINLPTPADDPTDPLAHSLNGFLLLVNLFRPFDDAFTALWNKTRGDYSQSHLSALQKQFSDTLPSYLNSSEAQFAELRPNQQWLKSMMWQMSVASGNLTSTDQFPYGPIDVSRDLLPMVSHLSPTLGLLGLNLIEKLFDIGCALSDVLAMQPVSRDPFTVGPRQHLHQLLNILSVLRNGDHRFLPLLLSKVHDVLPRLANPVLQNMPENAPALSIDIFDGFGNAGMAHPPNLPLEEFETKFAVRHLENGEASGSGAAGTATNDMSSPFASSPDLMSPGAEYPHGIAGDFNSLPEMVMSPMVPGQGPLSQSGGMNAQHGQHQHHQHPSISGIPNMTGHLSSNANTPMNPAPNMTLSSQSLNPGQQYGQNLGQNLNSGMNTNNLVPRPGAQRANSFVMANAPPIRTIADFHALQRANSDMSTLGSLTMNSVGQELDFNTLR